MTALRSAMTKGIGRIPVDVSSWFRQKRQGIRPVPFDEIRIPLTATPTFGLVVYCRLGKDAFALPKPGDLLEHAYFWTENHVQEPLASAIREFTERGLLNIFVHERHEMPEPPDDVLRAYNPGEVEERRFRNATHAIVIGAPDLLAPPRIGLWTVVAAARGIASAVPGGVVVDPEFPRLLSLESLNKDLASDGHLCVPEHILIPYSTDAESGLVWITTKGMARFGLPEIEICDAPPNLAGSLMPILNGLAQRLVIAAMVFVDSVSDDEDAPEIFSMPSQLRFGISDIRAAYEDTGWVDNSRPRATNEPSAIIRLEMGEQTRGSDNFPPCVRMVPPRGFKPDIGVWLNRLLSSLLGSDAQIEPIETDDSAMEQAHLDALANLDQIRSRFRAGFRSGEVLHVKHGFPTESDGREFMWIAVTVWEGDRVRGYIANDPQYRRDLNAGQMVEISEADIYDWMIAHTDGRIEGAYTNRVLDQRDIDSTEMPEDGIQTEDGAQG